MQFINKVYFQKEKFGIFVKLLKQTPYLINTNDSE